MSPAPDFDERENLVALLEEADERLAQAEATAWEAGVRQAITWLRADYPYGTGPDWRENGCDWIANRLADHRRAALSGEETPVVMAAPRLAQAEAKVPKSLADALVDLFWRAVGVRGRPAVPHRFLRCARYDWTMNASLPTSSRLWPAP